MNLKRILSIILATILSFGTCTVAFAENQTTVPDGYIGIYTAEDLNNIRNNLSGKYILMNDIDLSVYENWEPIGTNNSPFTGIFDGKNFSIKNLSLKPDNNTVETDTLGIWGFIKKAAILNLKIDNLNININFPYNSNFFVGGIVAYCYDSKIDSCEVKGNVSIISGGNIYAGGIVGYISDANKSTVIKKCVSQVNIEIIGENNSIWDLDVVEYTYAGGIAGYAFSAEKITKCTNTGTLSVNSINVGMVGCIVGNSEDAEILKCKNTGEISAYGTCVINEAPVNNTLWNKIQLFFDSFLNVIFDVFKLK